MGRCGLARCANPQSSRLGTGQLTIQGNSFQSLTDRVFAEGFANYFPHCESGRSDNEARFNTQK